ncbi:SEC-C metal-binding domain-containing protein [Candidatus Avelusimicrobium luingense]|uniref:SEC-C metal-binding domain-containing protein n=1 Tax=Candidatus Avelusimicrobium luingense TaxID=3416211 RepID=UPI003D0E2F14
MIWNPFKKKQNADKSAPQKKESIEERIEREIDALPAMLKGKLKDPQVKKRFIDIAKRMEQDGVDFKSIRQMKKWMKTHEAELRAEGGAPVQKVETVVHEGPRVGRNDPCPCGSGKKYKKCCGADK